MSGYIFGAPPPPPPPATGQQIQSNSHRGGGHGRGRGRGNGNFRGRGGPRFSRGGGGGGEHYGGRRGGGAGGPRGQADQKSFQPPSSPPTTQPSPSQLQSVHLNPAFFPQLLQQQQQQQQNHLTQSVQPSRTNLFFSHPESSSPPLSYGDLSPAASAANAYRFEPPAAPPPLKKQKTAGARPDMSRDEWLAMNSGMLIGTSIKPPETPEEIAAWIAERRKRFPTAAKRALAAEEERRAKAKVDAERLKRMLQMERERKEAEEREKAEKEREKAEEKGGGTHEAPNEQAVGGPEDEDEDAPPEEMSTQVRTATRDDRQKKPQHEKPRLCKTFSRTGACPMRKCRFRHEARPESGGKGPKKPPLPKSKKSLYDRFVENEMEHENELAIEVIKYLVETGALVVPDT